MPVHRFHSIYTALSVTASKVLGLLEEPVIENEAQEMVWTYLRRFVGNLLVHVRAVARAAAARRS